MGGGVGNHVGRKPRRSQDMDVHSHTFLRASSLAFQPEGGDAHAISFAHTRALTTLLMCVRAPFSKGHVHLCEGLS